MSCSRCCGNSRSRSTPSPAADGATSARRRYRPGITLEPSYRRADLWRDLKLRITELADSKQLLPAWIIDEADNDRALFFSRRVHAAHDRVLIRVDGQHRISIAVTVTGMPVTSMEFSDSPRQCLVEMRRDFLADYCFLPIAGFSVEPMFAYRLLKGDSPRPDLSRACDCRSR